MFQHPDPANGVFRTPAEEEHFRRGLNGLAPLFTHQYTFVLQVSRFPDEYPAGYELPDGANVAAYADRGWCSTEAAWAIMTKKAFLCCDLGQLAGCSHQCDYSEILRRCAYQSRPTPKTPEQFVAELSQKVFTNGKEDHPLVGRLYNETFFATFARAEKLVYRAVSWGDEEVRQLMLIAATRALTKLRALDLNTNRISDAGAECIAQALAAGHLPSLAMLNLYQNPIGDAGYRALSEVVPSTLHNALQHDGGSAAERWLQSGRVVHVATQGDNGIFVNPLVARSHDWGGGRSSASRSGAKPRRKSDEHPVQAQQIRLYISRPGDKL